MTQPPPIVRFLVSTAEAAVAFHDMLDTFGRHAAEPERKAPWSFVGAFRPGVVHFAMQNFPINHRDEERRAVKVAVCVVALAGLVSLGVHFLIASN